MSPNHGLRDGKDIIANENGGGSDQTGPHSTRTGVDKFRFTLDQHWLYPYILIIGYKLPMYTMRSTMPNFDVEF